MGLCSKDDDRISLLAIVGGAEEADLQQGEDEGDNQSEARNSQEVLLLREGFDGMNALGYGNESDADDKAKRDRRCLI